ncbi:MAG: DUF2066 domain-containing protein [Pseudomonadales bacterium]|nr:DUF2066 domain-containing protein [Pseudomonadales bacterium]
MFRWLQIAMMDCLRGISVYLLCSPLLLASEAVDLFTFTVDVDSESRQERAVASRSALKTLFVRATGDTLVLESYPLLANSLTKVDRYIASFSYATVIEKVDSELIDSYTDLDIDIEPSDTSDDVSARSAEEAVSEPVEILRLQLVFQAEAIKTLLRQAGAPFWQANRPGVLVWLVEQQANDRVLINAANAPQFYRALNRGAEARGIPLIQPLLDLEEASQINADDVWMLSVPIISKASERYDNGAVLVGKLSQAYDKSWFGQWTLLYRGERKIEYFRGGDLAKYFSLGTDMVADRLAADYAVVTSQQQGRDLTIKFSGVKGHNDYVALSEYLRQVPALKAIQLSHIDGEFCYFSLDATHDINKVRALIELNKRILPSINEDAMMAASNRLEYYWQSIR